MTQPTRIIRLESENIKKLVAVDITPSAHVVTIGGKNGAGKSSTVDSIDMALGGGDSLPDVPVRVGEAKAKITLTLDNGLVVRRTFTAAGGTSLVVESADGARYNSPQKMLDGLTVGRTFDPLAFMRLDPKPQAEKLRSLVNIDFSALNAQRDAIYNERTVIGKQHTQAQAVAQSMPYHDDVPFEPVSVVEVAKELEEARAKNRSNADYRDALVKIDQKVSTIAASLTGAKENVSKLRAALAEAEALVATITQEAEHSALARAEVAAVAAALVDVDTSRIITRMREAEGVNAKIAANKSRQDALAKAKAIGDQWDELTKKIEAIDAQKGATLKATKFPIEGLTFDERGVIFNGLPLSQASSAEQLRVSLAIGIAQNPTLKIMFIRDGSLLDDDSLKIVADMARQAGAQVWIEVVSTDDKVQIVIENGAVKETREPLEFLK